MASAVERRVRRSRWFSPSVMPSERMRLWVALITLSGFLEVVHRLFENGVFVSHDRSIRISSVLRSPRLFRLLPRAPAPQLLGLGVYRLHGRALRGARSLLPLPPLC